MKSAKLLLGTILAVGMLWSANAFAQNTVKTNQYLQLLRNVSVLELPAQAAKMIHEAKAENRSTVTVEVIAAISVIKPAAVPAVVGTVAQNEPEQAATAAAAAIEYQPDLAPAVVRAATVSVPKQVSAIVIAACGRAPSQYQRIAIAAAEAAPTASPQILNGVAAAIPALKSAIEQAAKTSASAAQPIEVSPIIMAAAKIAGPTVALTPEPSLKVSSAPALASAAEALSGTASGPVVGSPFHNLPRAPGEVTPNDTYQVPTGGRNYAAP
jgi:hypothetical protein